MTYEYAFWYLAVACLIALAVILQDGKYSPISCLILLFGGMLWPFTLLFLLLVATYITYTNWRES